MNKNPMYIFDILYIYRQNARYFNIFIQ